MCNEVNRLQLKLSDKSKIIAVNPTTNAAAEILNKENITVGTAKVCNGVGVQSSAGSARAASTLNNRINKTNNRKNQSEQGTVRK